MIKIKVKEGKGKTCVEGEIRDLVVEAGCVIWALKDLIKREQLMPDEDMKTYLTAFVLADKQEDVIEFLKKINF